MTSADLICAIRNVARWTLFLGTLLLFGSAVVLPLLTWLETAALASLRSRGRCKAPPLLIAMGLDRSNDARKHDLP